MESVAAEQAREEPNAEELPAGRLVVVLNATAGAAAGSDVREALEQALRRAGLTPEIRAAESGASATDLAREAVASGAAVVVAAGGDGTVNAVASVVAGTDVALGVLPLGTLNHFAKDLSLPLDLPSAAAVLARGRVVRVDVGEVNGRIFVNTSSLGLYPRIVEEREAQRQELGRGKWHALFWASLNVLRRYPLLDVRLVVDGKDVARQTPFVFVGNNVYEMEMLRIGARRCLHGGQLSVYAAHRTGRFGLFRLALRAVLGRLSRAADFEAYCATELVVETRRPSVRVATDGEVTRMSSPLRYRIRPGVLRVVAPPAGDAR
jgi:diacylglycerol kinase family enzyme